jgi:transcriptional regulator with XRE-family HTH domain
MGDLCTLRGMAIGERLRKIREEVRPKVSQETLGKRLGRNQRWVSQRESGEVGCTVDEAVEMLDGLGFAAEIVVVPKDQKELIKQIASARPAGAAAAIRLARVWDSLEPGVRDLLEAAMSQAEQRQTESSASEG